MKCMKIFFNDFCHDEPSGSRHIRRIPHAGRGMTNNRARRSQMQFASTGGLASLSPNSRDSMDPIAGSYYFYYIV